MKFLTILAIPFEVLWCALADAWPPVPSPELLDMDFYE